MTRNDIVRALNEEYDRLRTDNQRERDRRIGEVIAKDPSMEALIYGGRDLFQKQVRLLLAHPEQAAGNAPSGRRERQKAQAAPEGAGLCRKLSRPDLPLPGLQRQGLGGRRRARDVRLLQAALDAPAL